jgi:hypothetical protein
MPTLLPVYEHPDDALGGDLGGLPVGVVELGGVGDEALARHRDVDPEGVDGDAGLAQLGRGGHRQVLEGQLRHPVGHEPGDVVERGRRRHVEDPSPAARPHGRDQGADGEQRGAQVDVQHEVEPLQLDPEVTGERDRGVVHEDVDAPEGVGGRGHHRLDVLVAGEVRRHRDGLAAGLDDAADGGVDRAGEPQRRGVGGARRAGDARAEGAERDGGGGADAAAGAGHDRDLASQVHRRRLGARSRHSLLTGLGRGWSVSRFAA